MNPLTTKTTDLGGLDGFLLRTDKLMASELWALSTGEEFKAAIGLWCRAWTQSPPGSLPDDDRVLAAFSGVGARWKKVKAVALRGFVKCDDGRLYHRVLCEEANRAAAAKIDRHKRTKAASEARERGRNGARNVDETEDVTSDFNDRNDLLGKGSKGKGREDSTKNTEKIASSSSILRDSPAEHDASHPIAAAAASPVEDFEEKCLKASGLTRKPAGFQVILDLGLPFDRQILPAIQSVAARRKAQNDACPVSSWSYFIPAIREFSPARCAAAGPPMVFVERGTAAWREQISRGHRDGLVKHDRGKDGWFFPAEPLAAAAQ